jgi:hypothetical protein
MARLHNAPMIGSDSAVPVAAPQAVSDAPPQAVPDTPLTRGIVKNRHVLWIILAVFYLLAFNGTWRVGRDSALYRGLAHSLAIGKGYVFGDFGARQVHRGFPLLLAGLEKLFGPADLPPILLIHLLSLGCLVLTYKLVRLRFPEWVAVIVTFAVGINGWYLELTEEMLTDIPFLLGMLAALYGWERIRSDGYRVKPWPLVFLLGGFGFAALMRPTIWILAIAWSLVCIWGLITGPKRAFHAACLAILLLGGTAIFVVRGFHPLAGGYEQDAITAIGDIATKLPDHLLKMLGAELAYGFFGQKWVWITTHLMDALAIAASLLLWRRNPLWTLLILLTVAVTLVMGPVPRYYVMVLPLMMLSWVVLSIEIARRVPHRWLEVALLTGFAAVVIPNAVRCGKVIGEQRHWNNQDEGPRWSYVKAMSEHVQELVAPGEKVIAPGASIMSYLSGRDVVMQRDILPARKSEYHWPEHLAGLNIRYAVFPSRLYKEGERRIRELMDKGVIVPVERVAKEGEMALMRVEIRLPPPGQDWRSRPVTFAPVGARTTISGTTRPSPQALVRKHRQQVAARKAGAMKRAAIQAKQKKLAQAERQRKQQAAARALTARKKRAKQRAATRPAATQPGATSLGGGGIGGPVGRVAQRLDLLPTELARPVVDAVTTLARLVPVPPAGQDPVPERPGPALKRADVVNGTDLSHRRPRARTGPDFLEEDAVVLPLRGAAFLEADA